MNWVSTHSLGVMCGLCHEVLEPDNCCSGEPHGFSYQNASKWAARAWPNHTCFVAEAS